MNISILSSFLNDIVPSFILIENYIFVDRFDRGMNGVLKEIENYENIKEASYWINMVPVDPFIDKIFQNRTVEFEETLPILEIYRKSWIYGIHFFGLGHLNFEIKFLRDDEYGDIFVHLSQEN